MSDPIIQAIERFNELNSQDPQTTEVDGVPVPKELVAAERLERWVISLEGQPSPALRLAARCQHLMRWTVPRTDYPEGRVGYLKWRKDLSRKHADLAEEVLTEVGASRSLIDEVRSIVQKEGLKTNPATQTMEDALCLSFLQHEFATFSDKHDDEKVIDIVQKTWRKMSVRGHEHALALPFSGRSQVLVQKALTSPN